MSVRVFAFGSNMCSGRFRAYGVNPRRRGIAAVLKGYRLRFDKRSTRDCSGKANIQQHDRAEVWGVLYEIPENELQTLDDGEGGYERRILPVHIAEEKTIEAWVYVARAPDPDPVLRPYTWYKRFLVEGAIQHALPAAYIQMLEAIEANEDADHDRDRRKRTLPCSE